MNEADSRYLESQLEALGLFPEIVPAKADVIILNTCVIRQQAEDKAVSRLSFVDQLKRKRPQKVIGLMGCMVGHREAPGLKKRFPFIDVFMPPSDTAPLLEFLEERELCKPGKGEATLDKSIHNAIQNEEYPLSVQRRGVAVTANVPIVLGCSHACTFCVIPYRRGAERSRSRDEILAEISSLSRQGVREVMLLGQIVDRYGVDFESSYDLADLLRDIAWEKQLYRIRFLTGHPNYFTERMIDAVRDIPKVMPHIELPVQSGSDKVLQNMNRGYTSEEFKNIIKKIRNKIPEATIHTDVIVGFPGETENEFMETYHLLEALRLDKVHLAKYSERPKTMAARKLKDDVTEKEKEKRWRMIDALMEQIMREKNEKYLNREVEVLFEEKVKERWRGRTPCNRLVFVENKNNLRGQLCRVRISWTGPYSLLGNIDR